MKPCSYQADKDEGQLDDVCIRNRKQPPKKSVQDWDSWRYYNADGQRQPQNYAHRSP